MPTMRGSVRLGRLTLLEGFSLSEGSDRELKLTVQASPSTMSAPQVERRQQDLLSLDRQLIPVVFTDRPSLSGFYQVLSVDLSQESYAGFTVATASVTLARVGNSNTVDIESRLAGARSRTNDFSVVGDIWHAAPIGHSGYHTEWAAQNAVNRVGEDGTITVYRGIRFGANPRWSATPEVFGRGRVRYLDEFGEERSGSALPFDVEVSGGLFPAVDLFPGADVFPDAGDSTAAFTLSNGLVKVELGSVGAALKVSTYSGGAWHAKDWDVRVNGGSIAPLSGVDILHNTYDTVAVRLYKGFAPGRSTIDMTLRRGSRFVEIYARAFAPTILQVIGVADEAATIGAGFVAATSNDAAGNRFIVGSARSFVGNILHGGVMVAAGASLDAFIGTIVGGASAVPGDRATELYAQYIGSLVERQIGVRR